nr:4-(cytidine 5'-diphospho)-2-C-methyl-D-erythritol kinase [uncultured Gellertiella sp.]
MAVERIEEPAPAKVNLALHVTGLRADGYHLLETLVTFTEAGDRLWLEAAPEDRFTLSGPFAPALHAAGGHGGNLVLKARDLLRAWLRAQRRPAPPVHIHLDKQLPVSSGIGGGSADAAASLRGLARLWQAAIPEAALRAIALSLGADVPMCLVSRPLVARGIGEEITPLALPALQILLVNPMVPVSTPAIFRRLATKANPPLPADIETLADNPLSRLGPLRNDLQHPAEMLEPDITGVLAALQETGAALVRMSGSGATCFGLHADSAAMQAASADIKARHPGWFISPTRTLP